MPTPIFSGYPTPPYSIQDEETGATINIPEPLEYGNINLGGRRPVKISVSKPEKIVPLAKKEGEDFNWGTVFSITIGPRDLAKFPGQKVMVVLPTVDIERSLILTEAQATQKFEQDGLHLGIFSSESVVLRNPTTGKNSRRYLADAYAEALHQLEEQRLEKFLAEDPTLKPWNAANYSVDPSVIQPKDSGFITEVFTIAGMEREFQDSLSGRLLSLNVSYSMSMTTQLSATFDDRGYELTENGYFDPRREYKYRGLLFEVVSCETSAGSAGYPQATVELAPKCVQELKRDKKPESITGVNGYEYARRVAARCGMNFVGEKSNKQQTVFKGRGQNADESAWTVLTSSGQDGQFFVFEVDNTLVYASGAWLMWRFGLSEKENKKKKKQRFLDLRYDPTLPNNGAPSQKILGGRPIGIDENGDVIYDGSVTFVDENGVFELTTWPTVRMSENDGLEGTGSCSVLSPNGRIIRPGHTVYLTTIPTRFRAGYLVQDVNYSEFSNDPVDIGLVMVQKPKDQTKPDTKE